MPPTPLQLDAREQGPLKSPVEKEKAERHTPPPHPKTQARGLGPARVNQPKHTGRTSYFLSTARLSRRFWALPEVMPIKTLIQVTQHLLGKKKKKRMQASSKEKQQQKSNMEPQRDAGGLLFPERRCHFRGVSCALCGHKRQFSVSFTRRRPKRNKNFLTGPHGAPSSPASGKTAHLMAACCMHAPPLLYALLPGLSLHLAPVFSFWSQTPKIRKDTFSGVFRARATANPLCMRVLNHMTVPKQGAGGEWIVS